MESPEFAHNDKLSYRYKSIHEVMKMSRRARQRSGTDIYHVILRGINRQQIFYDEEDYDYFIRLLNRFQKVSQYEVYAYCLMGNHIHLLIKVHQESLGTIFQRIGASFVYWYNLKYQRVGHLFQDRFKSEPVENERYFLTVMRYIFRNPVKAGIPVKAIVPVRAIVPVKAIIPKKITAMFLMGAKTVMILSIIGQNRTGTNSLTRSAR